MAIRFNSQLKSEIRRTVKAFNAKIRRLESKGVSAALLPSKISSKELQKGFNSKRELRARLKALWDFTSAGETETTEGGLIGTAKLIQYREGEANKAIKAINAEYQRAIKVDTRYPMMKGEYVNSLEAKMRYLSRDIRKMDIQQVQIFNKNLLTPEQRKIKDEQFYTNFTRMIFFDAYKAGLPPSLINRITTLMEELSPAELLELHGTEPTFKGVTDIYMLSNMENVEVPDEEVEERFNALEARLQEIVAKKK